MPNIKIGVDVYITAHRAALLSYSKTLPTPGKGLLKLLSPRPLSATTMIAMPFVDFDLCSIRTQLLLQRLCCPSGSALVVCLAGRCLLMPQ